MDNLAPPMWVKNRWRKIVAIVMSLSCLTCLERTPKEVFSAEPARAVRKALDRSAEYLRRTQQKDGTWHSWGSHTTGETALAGMALVAAGVAPESPEIASAHQAVRLLVSKNTETYDVSLGMMFLDQLGDAKDRQLLKDLGNRLRGGQLPSGAWGYGVSRLSAGDNSNTQFAAIACWVARRHGVVQDAAFQKIDGYFRGSFVQAVGGWGYESGSRVTPTMTCAGLAGLAVYRGAEQERRDSAEIALSGTASKRRGERDPVVDAALKALGQELRFADSNPGHSINTDLYFFWSLERVAMIYGLKDIGGVDWYRWGSMRLLKSQAVDGQWQGSGKWQYEKAVGTSFAMLFLSRMNVAADLTAAVGLGAGSGETPPGPELEPQGGSGGTRFLRRSESRGASVRQQNTPEGALHDQDLDPRQR